MVGNSERPESALCEPVSLPLVVPGEIDVLPAERGEVLEQLGIDRLTVACEALDRPFDVHGIPERNRGRESSQSHAPWSLCILRHCRESSGTAAGPSGRRALLVQNVEQSE